MYVRKIFVQEKPNKIIFMQPNHILPFIDVHRFQEGATFSALTSNISLHISIKSMRACIVHYCTSQNFSCASVTGRCFASLAQFVSLGFCSTCVTDSGFLKACKVATNLWWSTKHAIDTLHQSIHIHQVHFKQPVVCCWHCQSIIHCRILYICI